MAVGVSEAQQKSRSPYNQAPEEDEGESGAAEEGTEEQQEGAYAEVATADIPDPIDDDDGNGGTACEMLHAFDGITPRATWPNYIIINTCVI